MEAQGGLQWKVQTSNGSSKVLVSESGFIRRNWLLFLGRIFEMKSRVGSFFKKAWKMGVEDPRKVMHSFKVAIALTLVSLVYYVTPIYEGVGQKNAIWAVMTVVVAFEYTAGGTIYKCINRIIGTVLAGTLAVIVQWIAVKFGEPFELVILGATVFIAATIATFTRFIPIIKLRFDYAAMIFILTYGLIAVSGFRDLHLYEMGYLRIVNITIGILICMFTSILVCPVWAGEELHLLITRNMETLANSLNGCVAEYFKKKNNNGKVDNEDKTDKTILGYKCVLNSKSSEESFANFAIWEPAHGCFRFRHPWKQYLKIAASMRNCAFIIDVLHSCINSEFQAPDFVKKYFSDACIALGFHSSMVLKEVAISIATMKSSSKMDLLLKEMRNDLRELLNVLESLSSFPTALPSSPEAETETEAETENPEERQEPISTPTTTATEAENPEERKEPISTPTTTATEAETENPEQRKEPISTPTTTATEAETENPKERKEPISTPTTTATEAETENHKERKEPVLTVATTIALSDVVPLLTAASLMIEIVARIEEVVKAAKELAKLANFKPQLETPMQPSSEYQDQQTIKVLEQV